MGKMQMPVLNGVLLSPTFGMKLMLVLLDIIAWNL